MHNAFLHLFGKFMAEGLGFSTALEAVLDAQPWAQTTKPRMLQITSPARRACCLMNPGAIVEDICCWTLSPSSGLNPSPNPQTESTTCTPKPCAEAPVVGSASYDTPFRAFEQEAAKSQKAQPRTKTPVAVATPMSNLRDALETTIIYWGYIGIMEKRMETTIVYWGYIGIMEKRMETTIVYWGYTGIMEKKMETTIVYWGYIGIMEKTMETTIWLLVLKGVQDLHSNFWLHNNS